MITVTNTEKLAGVTISGDFHDLDGLVEAFYTVTINDMRQDLTREDKRYLTISLRLLGTCYEIRHAAQGDREILARDNGIDDHHLVALGQIVPRENIYYSCNVLYPEMILVTMALNDLVKYRISRLATSGYSHDAPFHKAVAWDRTIAVIRTFQAAFQEAVAQTLTPASFSRWQTLVHNPYFGGVSGITNPFVDAWNIRYLAMKPEERNKKLLTITKRFAEYYSDPEDRAYRDAIHEGMKEHDCAETDLRFPGLEYPGVIEW